MEAYDLLYKDIYVQVTTFRGDVMVHIRVKDIETGRFTSSGIALTAHEWSLLEDVWERVYDNISDEKAPAYMTELGDRGRRVSVRRFRGSSFVDLRCYYVPEEGTPRPTRRGITLNRAAFALLSEFRPLVRQDIRVAAERLRESDYHERELHRTTLLARAAAIREREEAGEGTSSGPGAGTKRPADEGSTPTPKRPAKLDLRNSIRAVAASKPRVYHTTTTLRMAIRPQEGEQELDDHIKDVSEPAEGYDEVDEAAAPATCDDGAQDDTEPMEESE